MLTYFAEGLAADYPVLNVLTYITVRAGGAVVTGFFVCVIAGPYLIRWLQRLKIGQYIKREHVNDLHDLHQGKAGTPTMGGLLFIVSTVAALVFWGGWASPMLWIVTGVLCTMGAVGFLDDFIKLRRKKNDGMSVRMKLLGQIVVGLALGTVVMVYPVTLGPNFFSTADVTDWDRLAVMLCETENGHRLPVPDSEHEALIGAVEDGIARSERGQVLSVLNALVAHEAVLPGVSDGTVLRGAGPALFEQSRDGTITDAQRLRLNRLILEDQFSGLVNPGSVHVHSSVAIPGLKDVMIPLGIGYILFVVLIIVATSNAVNLTDGLDGLAVGASIISLFALTGIAYVVSRVDWSGYLFVTHIPGASELAVFGAALLGSGLGFLWYNAYPAEVFMGDTGSLSLGGVMGAMAVLTKQELLLPIVGGLFVLEAASVIIQVASFKLRGKRVFRMAPLHHHFELKGWSESKVTIRFWILAFIFALMSLSTLKLR